VIENRDASEERAL